MYPIFGYTTKKTQIYSFLCANAKCALLKITPKIFPCCFAVCLTILSTPITNRINAIHVLIYANKELDGVLTCSASSTSNPPPTKPKSSSSIVHHRCLPLLASYPGRSWNGLDELFILFVLLRSISSSPLVSFVDSARCVSVSLSH